MWIEIRSTQKSFIFYFHPIYSDRIVINWKIELITELMNWFFMIKKKKWTFALRLKKRARSKSTQNLKYQNFLCPSQAIDFIAFYRRHRLRRRRQYFMCINKMPQMVLNWPYALIVCVCVCTRLNETQWKLNKQIRR